MAALASQALIAALPFLLDKMFSGKSGGSQGQAPQGGSQGRWGGSFTGTPGSIQAMPNFSPEQQSMLGQLVSGLGGQGGPLQGGLQNLQQMLSGGSEAYEKPAMRQFNEQIIPGIAERFTGMGAGAQQSSAFGQQLGQAGAGLSENLAMQREGQKSQGLQQLMQMLGIGMQSPFQYMQIPGTEGGLSKLLGGLGSGIGSGIGMAGSAWLGNKMKTWGQKSPQAPAAA